jgi:hypothetical protein
MQTEHLSSTLTPPPATDVGNVVISTSVEHDTPKRTVSSRKRKQRSATAAAESEAESDEAKGGDAKEQQQQQIGEEAKTEDDEKAAPEEKEKRSNIVYQPLSRCPHSSRDVVYAALPHADLDEFHKIASALPGCLDARGRLRTAALRTAVNTRAEWVMMVHIANARNLSMQAVQLEQALKKSKEEPNKGVPTAASQTCAGTSHATAITTNAVELV